MSFETLICVFLALYGLLNFVVQPRLTKAWNASRTASKVAKAGLFAAVQFVRDACFIASVMYLAFGLLTIVLGFGFSSNSNFLEWLVASASRLHDGLEWIQDAWSHWFVLFPLSLIIWLQWRTQRNKFSGHFEQLVDGELDRANHERAEHPEKWTNLGPDEKMRALDEQITAAQRKLAVLAPRGPKDRTERRRLLRQVSQLREQRCERDYDRRVDVSKADVKEDPSKQPAWQRILLSRGLYSDLQGFSKLLSRVTLAMLAVALIGVAGTAGLTEDVWNHIIHLDNLRVEARKAEAEKRWEDHPGRQTSLSDSDRKAINHLTNDFAKALSRNPRWQSLQREIRPDPGFERRVTRRAILEEVKLPDPADDSKAAFSDGLSADEESVLQDIVTGKANQSHVGRVIADRDGAAIKSWFGNKWEGIRQAIIEHAKTYHEPLRIDDLQGELVDRVVAAAFDATGSEEASDVIKQARDGMSDAVKEAVRSCVETELHRVVEDLDKGTPYGEAMKRVRTDDISVSKGTAEKLGALINDRKLPDARDFVDRMAANPGHWNGQGSGVGPGPGPSPGPQSQPPSGETANRDRIVNEIAREATHDRHYSLSEEPVGALAEYEDHFPRSVASQSETVLGRTLARYQLPADTAEFTQMAEVSVERAFSFSMLRGFSKVGGVLIGRAPQGAADIRDIDWEENGRNITITLADADGLKSRFGPFDKSLVHQSLAYAADGRPVAVTMTVARPVMGLKIFLHPSLVDTPLGCRLEALDRLVDTYAGSRRQLPERQDMTQAYFEQVSVYNVALAQRIAAVAEKVRDPGWINRRATSILEENSEWAQKGLQQSGLFSEASILRRKPEFFDPSLIKTAKACQRPDLKQFENCVLDTYRSSRTLREFKEDELRRWFIDPTEIQPWSGVRERAYRVDDSLSFLKVPAGSSVEDSLWPFDFMVQIAFTSAAVNVPDKEQERYVDRQPIEFDKIQGKIENLVKAGIDKDGLRPQFEDLRNFAILQRLFRAALNGNLGSRFPTLKLAQLTRDTAGAAPYFHTKRWNTSTVAEVEFRVRRAMALRDGLQPWMNGAAEKLPRCYAALRQTTETASDRGAVAACQFEEYSDAARQGCPEGADHESPGCIWRAVVADTRALEGLQEVEIAFGVLDDERQSSMSCSSLASPNAVASMR